MTIALTWKGCWLGSWWEIEKIRDYIEERKDLGEQEFELIKWLRIPVLHPVLQDAIAEAVYRQPSLFIKSWKTNAQLPSGLQHHTNIDGLDSVIRYFLWVDFPQEKSKSVISTLEHCYGNALDEASCINKLKMFATISPILLWKGMEYFLDKRRGNDPNLDLLNNFICVELGLQHGSSTQQIDFMLNQYLKRVSNATSISERRIDDLTSKWLESIRNDEWYPEDDESCLDLLHLGETISGRAFITAKMWLYWRKLARI